MDFYPLMSIMRAFEKSSTEIKSMWSLALLFVVSGVYCYLKAFLNGLAAKRWACAGLILGPVLLPLLMSSIRMARHRQRGLTFTILPA